MVAIANIQFWQVLEKEIDDTKFSKIGTFHIQVAVTKKFDAIDLKQESISVSTDARSFTMNNSLVNPLWQTVLYARVRVIPENGGTEGRW